jgi:hypothetical protein
VSGQQQAPAVLYPRENPCTHYTGGWVGPRASPDGWKTPPHRDSIPGPSSPQSVAIPTELPGPRVCEYYSCLIHKTNQVFVFACPITYCFPAYIPWEKISVNRYYRRDIRIYTFAHINKKPTESREQRNLGNAVRGK